MGLRHPFVGPTPCRCAASALSSYPKSLIAAQILPTAIGSPSFANPSRRVSGAIARPTGAVPRSASTPAPAHGEKFPFREATWCEKSPNSAAPPNKPGAPSCTTSGLVERSRGPSEHHLGPPEQTVDPPRTLLEPPRTSLGPPRADPRARSNIAGAPSNIAGPPPRGPQLFLAGTRLSARRGPDFARGGARSCSKGGSASDR